MTDYSECDISHRLYPKDGDCLDCLENEQNESLKNIGVDPQMMNKNKQIFCSYCYTVIYPGQNYLSLGLTVRMCTTCVHSKLVML
jgi:hypothetical protein